tara:strand:+ start:853 stop:1593 length:741 start_codon:yes stop_codon:yes gene_type:complete
MNKILLNTYSEINLYKKKSIKSEIVSQMIYGDSFLVLKKNKKWLKIKTKYDRYKGFVEKKNYGSYLKPTHKISSLSPFVYKNPNKKIKINKITFGSKITIEKKHKQFVKFKKGWIEKNNIRPINYKDKNVFKKIKIFKNTKYKWGGKSFKGIDCSALVQICLDFNNMYCPRDTKDQVRYFKKNISLKNIKKNDIIFWKGHVAVALSKNKLIHAYGPLKKTLIMNIHETIDRIKRTSGLRVIAIKRI